MKRTRISVLLVIALLLQLYAPLTAGAADFTPNPQTEYAKRFIAACDGQTWFINEIERLLNVQQRTLDTITGAEDLVEIKSIGLKGRNRDYPEFCVTAKMRCKIELIFQGGSGAGCARLVYNITPTALPIPAPRVTMCRIRSR